jgi:membrane protein implicated in regulation of membrane protease activity
MPGFDTLNCIYSTLLFIGVGYAIFIVITGGVTDIDMPDVDIDIPGADISIGGADIPAGGLDAPDITVSPISPITIASFITTFGGIGIISIQLFNVRPEMSLVFATVGGLAAAGLVYAFVSQFLVRSQGSTVVRRGEIVGLQGVVTVPIGETTMGQVSYVAKSGRMKSMARSVDGSAIPRGQFVRIVRTIGAQVLVEPLSADSDAE